jgi:hypothetical protein
MNPAYPQFELPPMGRNLPSALEEISYNDLGQLFDYIRNHPEMQFKSVYFDKLVDTVRFDTGAVPANEFEMFKVPLGSMTTAYNGTTNYKKSRIDTNMVAQGQLPDGHHFWAVNMQAKVSVSGLLDNTVQTSGDNITLPSDPGLENQVVAADAVNATNLIQAIGESIHLIFTLDGNEFEGGAIEEFPSRYGYSGYAGGFAYVPGTAGTTIAANETCVNIGFGQPVNWPIARYIKGLRTFGVKLRVYNNFTNTRQFRVKVLLEGIRAKPVVG